VQHSKKRISFLIHLLVGLLLLIVLFSMVSVDELVAAFYHANQLYLLGALFPLTAHLALQVIKWQLLLRVVAPTVRFESAVVSFLGSLALGACTPGRLGEIPSRAYLLSHPTHPEVIGLALVDKIQFFLVLTIFGVPSLLILVMGSTPLFSSIVSGLIVTLLMMLFFRLHLLARVERFFTSERTRKWITSFSSAIASMKRKDHLLAFVLTICSHLFLIIEVLLLLAAFVSVEWFQASLAFSAMMLAKSYFPFSLADLGVREASAVLFYTYIGIAPAVALNTAFLLFLFNVVIPSLCALPILMKERLLPANEKKQ